MSGKRRQPDPKPSVPLNVEYAFVVGGKVVATVSWWREPGKSDFRSTVYSSSTRMTRLLPSGEGLAEQIRERVKDGRLVPIAHVAPRHSGLYMVFDRRPGHSRSYLIWTGEAVRGDGPTFLPETVYHFMRKSAAPLLTGYAEVHALLSGARVLKSFDSINTNARRDRVLNSRSVTAVDLGMAYLGS